MIYPNLTVVLTSRLILLLHLVFLVLGFFLVWEIIEHSRASTLAIDQILDKYNMQNEGAKTLADFKEDHPFLGMLFSGPVQHAFELPSAGHANHVLEQDTAQLLRTVRTEATHAAWWSWALLNLSLIYLLAMIQIATRLTERAVLFALTAISMLFFIIGISAPAMVIWTAPVIPFASGSINFVIQHEMRGIAAIIWELFTSSHWIIASLLLIFSILTPITKASLTFYITVSSSKERNAKIANFIHTISKWSMADVFVAGVLLALFALKSQEATRSIPCLGLYYFIGYCLLSLATGEVLVNSACAGGAVTSIFARHWSRSVVLGSWVAIALFMAVSAIYTQEQYHFNPREVLSAPDKPEGLNSTNLVLPVHR